MRRNFWDAALSLTQVSSFNGKYLPYLPNHCNGPKCILFFLKDSETMWRQQSKNKQQQQKNKKQNPKNHFL